MTKILKDKKGVFYLILILSIMFANTSVIFTKNSLNLGASPMIIGFLRLLMTTLIFIPYMLYTDKLYFLTLKKREIFTCFLAGAFLALHFLAYFSSLIYTNGFIATITGGLQPIVIAISSYFLFKEGISKKAIFSMFVALAGLMYIGILSKGGSPGSFIGFILSVFTALFFSAYLLTSKKAYNSVKPVTFLTLLFFSCMVFMLISVLITKTPVVGYQKAVYLNILALTIFCTILGHSILNIAVRYISATNVSVISLIGPLFAAFYEYLIFGILTTTNQIIGGIIITIGVILFLRNNKNKSNEVMIKWDL